MANPFKEAEKAKKKSPGSKGQELKEEQGSGQETEVPAVDNDVREGQTQELVVAAGETQAAESAPVSEVKKTSLASIYEDQRKFDLESRSVRLQIVITPSIAKKLEWLDKTNQIKSRNDLVNFLLERYVETKDFSGMEEK